MGDANETAKTTAGRAAATGNDQGGTGGRDAEAAHAKPADESLKVHGDKLAEPGK